MVFLLSACGQGEGFELYRNFFPVTVDDVDPFDGVSQLQATLDGETGALDTVDFEQRAEFGSIAGCESCRIELSGLSAGGERLSWGFSHSLLLGAETLKTTLFFSRDTTAVAHAGPSLVDPEEGLAPAGVPLGLRFGPARVTLAHNEHHLYLEVRVEDESVVANDPDIWEGDLVVLVLDGLRDSEEASRGFDDLALAFGSEHYVEKANPLGVHVLHSFLSHQDGYTVFAAIPLDFQFENCP